MSKRFTTPEDFNELLAAVQRIGGFKRKIHSLAADVDLAAANPAVETVMESVALPTMQIGDVFTVTIGLSKVTGAAVHTTKIRMGTAGDTSDAVLASSVTTAGHLSAGYRFDFKVLTKTTIRRLGNAATGSSPYNGSNSATGVAAVTVPDVTLGTSFLTCTFLNGNTSDDATLRTFTIELDPKYTI
jgi:hypothetical protein